MGRNYEMLSLETHLFFGRIMKEHAFFLMAGFPSKNTQYIKEADRFRIQFEELLRNAVCLSKTGIRKKVLCSNELVTNFTLGAEQCTEILTGIPIDTRITEAEKNLQVFDGQMSRVRTEGCIRELNRRSLRLLDGLIRFKERILRDVKACRLFTFNYPLLIEHILREAKMYRSLVVELERTGTLDEQDMWRTEAFWNRIMMEHALFIRGLLDPSEEVLIETANGFAQDYKGLLEEAKQKDCMVQNGQTEKVIEETKKYRDFKAAGAQGILDCKILSLIVPLLADHVLREANHYLRLLGSGRKE